MSTSFEKPVIQISGKIPAETKAQKHLLDHLEAAAQSVADEADRILADKGFSNVLPERMCRVYDGKDSVRFRYKADNVSVSISLSDMVSIRNVKNNFHDFGRDAGAAAAQAWISRHESAKPAEEDPVKTALLPLCGPLAAELQERLRVFLSGCGYFHLGAPLVRCFCSTIQKNDTPCLAFNIEARCAPGLCASVRWDGPDLQDLISNGVTLPVILEAYSPLLNRLMDQSRDPEMIRFAVDLWIRDLPEFLENRLQETGRHFILTPLTREKKQIWQVGLSDSAGALIYKDEFEVDEIKQMMRDSLFQAMDDDEDKHPRLLKAHVLESAAWKICFTACAPHIIPLRSLDSSVFGPEGSLIQGLYADLLRLRTDAGALLSDDTAQAFEISRNTLSAAYDAARLQISADKDGITITIHDFVISGIYRSLPGSDLKGEWVSRTCSPAFQRLYEELNRPDREQAERSLCLMLKGLPPHVRVSRISGGGLLEGQGRFRFLWQQGKEMYASDVTFSGISYRCGCEKWAESVQDFLDTGVQTLVPLVEEQRKSRAKQSISLIENLLGRDILLLLERAGELTEDEICAYLYGAGAPNSMKMYKLIPELWGVWRPVGSMDEIRERIARLCEKGVLLARESLKCTNKGPLVLCAPAASELLLSLRHAVPGSCEELEQVCRDRTQPLNSFLCEALFLMTADNFAQTRQSPSLSQSLILVRALESESFCIRYKDQIGRLYRVFPEDVLRLMHLQKDSTEGIRKEILESASRSYAGRSAGPSAASGNSR